MCLCAHTLERPEESAGTLQSWSYRGPWVAYIGLLKGQALLNQWVTSPFKWDSKKGKKKSILNFTQHLHLDMWSDTFVLTDARTPWASFLKSCPLFLFLKISDTGSLSWLELIKQARWLSPISPRNPPVSTSLPPFFASILVFKSGLHAWMASIQMSYLPSSENPPLTYKSNHQYCLLEMASILLPRFRFRRQQNICYISSVSFLTLLL